MSDASGGQEPQAIDLDDLRARSKRWQTTCYDTERCIEEIDRLRAKLAEVERLRSLPSPPQLDFRRTR